MSNRVRSHRRGQYAVTNRYGPTNLQPLVMCLLLESILHLRQTISLHLCESSIYEITVRRPGQELKNPHVSPHSPTQAHLHPCGIISTRRVQHESNPNNREPLVATAVVDNTPIQRLCRSLCCQTVALWEMQEQKKKYVKTI